MGEEKKRKEKEEEIQVWKLILVGLEHFLCLELWYVMFGITCVSRKP